jgi:transglutaminase-like putative cysteine protease
MSMRDFFCAIVLISAAATNTLAAPEEQLSYQVFLAGEPAGSLEIVDRRDGENLVQETALEISFSRAGLAQRLSLRSRFVESPEGRPLEAWSFQDLGGPPVTTSFFFEKDSVRIEGRQGETRIDRRESLAGNWLTPRQTEAETLRQLKMLIAAGSGRFSISTIDPLFGAQPIALEWVLDSVADPLEIEGETRPASRWRQTQSLAPGLVTIVHLDPNGEMLQSRSQLAGLEMTIVRRFAPATTTKLADAAPEIVARTLIEPLNKLEGNPRLLRRARFELSGIDATLVLPTVGYQSVERPDLQTLRVLIDLDRKELPRAEASPADLEPSIYINHHSPEVVALHAQAFADVTLTLPSQRAEHLRAFVHRLLERKDLRSLLATASEVARNRSGDCTEHAVLLAALLRADGIPARVAYGLIFTESFAGRRDVFGYHLWTQVHFAGAWHDLDATTSLPFDATHITIGTSALAQESSALTELGAALEALQSVEVKILEP